MNPSIKCALPRCRAGQSADAGVRTHDAVRVQRDDQKLLAKALLKNGMRFLAIRRYLSPSDKSLLARDHFRNRVYCIAPTTRWRWRPVMLRSGPSPRGSNLALPALSTKWRIVDGATRRAHQSRNESACGALASAPMASSHRIIQFHRSPRFPLYSKYGTSAAHQYSLRRDEGVRPEPGSNLGRGFPSARSMAAALEANWPRDFDTPLRPMAISAAYLWVTGSVSGFTLWTSRKSAVESLAIRLQCFRSLGRAGGRSSRKLARYPSQSFPRNASSPPCRATNSLARSAMAGRALNSRQLRSSIGMGVQTPRRAICTPTVARKSVYNSSKSGYAHHEEETDAGLYYGRSLPTFANQNAPLLLPRAVRTYSPRSTHRKRQARVHRVRHQSTGASPQAARSSMSMGYTKVPHKVIEALCSLRLTGPQMAVAFMTMRKTWGWQKEADRISLSQFCKLCKRDRDTIRGARAALIDLGILVVEKKHTRSRGAILRVERDVSSWRIPRGGSKVRGGKSPSSSGSKMPRPFEGAKASRTIDSSEKKGSKDTRKPQITLKPNDFEAVHDSGWTSIEKRRPRGYASQAH